MPFGVLIAFGSLVALVCVLLVLLVGTLMHVQELEEENERLRAAARETDVGVKTLAAMLCCEEAEETLRN